MLTSFMRFIIKFFDFRLIINLQVFQTLKRTHHVIFTENFSPTAKEISSTILKQSSYFCFGSPILLFPYVCQLVLIPFIRLYTYNILYIIIIYLFIFIFYFRYLFSFLIFLSNLLDFEFV